MNPITDTRRSLVRYVALWVAIAAAYGAAFGVAGALPASLAALDGAVLGIVGGIEGLILWSVLKYGVVEASTANFVRIGRVSLILGAGLLFIAVAVGAECLALYLTLESLPAAFAATIPARSLTVAAVYACFALWFWSAAHSEVGTPTADFSYAKRSGPVEDNGAGEVNDRDRGEPVEILERITVRGAGGRIEVIALAEIICIQAEGDYVAIVTAAGRRLKEGTMKYFEGALPRESFVRVHRSCIVAVGHISRIETSGREHTLILRGGPPVRISDTGYRLLKRTLGL